VVAELKRGYEEIYNYLNRLKGGGLRIDYS
jgi:hypothetical protein